MRCRKVHSSLSTYFRQELPADKAAEVKKHLEECSSCCREAEIVRSVQGVVKNISALKTSDGFNAALLQRVGREGHTQKKTKAYMPGRIPRFGSARLATVAAMAVITLAFGIGINFTGDISFSPQMTVTTSADETDDRYLTVQPTDNPLLDTRKSVSQKVQQYNRWREYSRSLRSGSVEQFMGGKAMLTSSNGSENLRFRPVIKNYIIVPVNQPAVNGRSTY